MSQEQRFFIENQPPKNLEQVREKVQDFVKFHNDKNPSAAIVLVTV